MKLLTRGSSVFRARVQATLVTEDTHDDAVTGENAGVEYTRPDVSER